jgi:hypothetical protein
MRIYPKVIAAAAVVLAFTSCSREVPVGENLLKNSSFEQINGTVPSHWNVKAIGGEPNAKEELIGLDGTVAFEGHNSFKLSANADVGRFYTLSQEIETRGAMSLQVNAMVKAKGLKKEKGQKALAGITLTYYTKDRERFKTAQDFYDVRINVARFTADDWTVLERAVRLPLGTWYVDVQCVLTVSGEIWFDNVEVDIPSAPPWNQSEGEHVTHYWLDERPYPDGAREFQEELYLSYATRLGIPPERMPRLSYFLYPDSAAVKEILGLDTTLHVDYDRREIHSINPAEDHEIVHMLTSDYGRLPSMLSEGTAFYLMGGFNGRPIQPEAQRLLLEDKMPSLEELLDPMASTTIEPAITIPTAASFVGYLIEFGGAERFLQLHGGLGAYSNYEAFAAAFEKVYDSPLAQAETVWRQTLARADFSKYQKEPEH